MDFYGILFDMKNGKKIPYSKNYFDTLFAAKLEELGVKTITGTLPIEFTSKGGAIQWTVYGNNTSHNYSAEGTLPLTFSTHTAGNASDWEIRGNNLPGENLFTETGSEVLQVTGDGAMRFGKSLGKLPAGTYALSYSGNVSTYVTQRTGSAYSSGSSSYSGSGTFSVAETVDEVIFRTAYPNDTTWANLGLTNIMIVRGSTAPDHYIPYQQGVGERTVNLFDKATATAGYRIAGDGTPYPDPRCKLSDYIEVSASTAYVINTYISYDDALAQYDANKTFIERTVSGSGNFTTSATTKYVRISMLNDNVNTKMLVQGSTAPSTYVPYGYEIPISVSGKNLVNSENNINSANISSNGSLVSSADFKMILFKIEQGETYTICPQYATSSGYVYGIFANKPAIGSQAYDQTRSIGVSTFVAPITGWCAFRDMPNASTSMAVKGSTAPTSYIPYFHNDYTFYIGSSPLTAGQSISKTSTGVDIELFEGENTVSTTLYNKPETSITYRDYLGVGEYVNGQWQIPLALSHITDNLFDKDATDTDNGYEDDTRTYWRQAIYGLRLFIEPNADYCTSEYIPVTAGTDYYPSDVDISIEALFSATFYTAEKTLIYMAFSSADKITAPENAAYIRVCVEKSKLNSAMLTTKPTSEYIPHKQSTDYTIPIDAPLTEGQSVSDTVEITAYEGTNTLDTTLTIKPDATITYK